MINRRTFIQSLLALLVPAGMMPRWGKGLVPVAEAQQANTNAQIITDHYAKGWELPYTKGQKWPSITVYDGRPRGLMYEFTDRGTRITNDSGDVVYSSYSLLTK